MKRSYEQHYYDHDQHYHGDAYIDHYDRSIVYNDSDGDSDYERQPPEHKKRKVYLKPDWVKAEHYDVMKGCCRINTIDCANPGCSKRIPKPPLSYMVSEWCSQFFGWHQYEAGSTAAAFIPPPMNHIIDNSVLSFLRYCNNMWTVHDHIFKPILARLEKSNPSDMWHSPWAAKQIATNPDKLISTYIPGNRRSFIGGMIKASPYNFYRQTVKHVGCPNMSTADFHHSYYIMMLSRQNSAESSKWFTESLSQMLEVDKWLNNAPDFILIYHSEDARAKYENIRYEVYPIYTMHRHDTFDWHKSDWTGKWYWHGTSYNHDDGSEGGGPSGFPDIYNDYADIGTDPSTEGYECLEIKEQLTAIKNFFMNKHLPPDNKFDESITGGLGRDTVGSLADFHLLAPWNNTYLRLCEETDPAAAFYGRDLIDVRTYDPLQPTFGPYDDAIGPKDAKTGPTIDNFLADDVNNFGTHYVYCCKECASMGNQFLTYPLRTPNYNLFFECLMCLPYPLHVARVENQFTDIGIVTQV